MLRIMINKKDLHIIVFTGVHPVLSFFVEQFIVFLKENAIDYYIANADDSHTYNCKSFDQFMSQKNTVVFMYNNIGLGLLLNDGDSIWKSYDVPVFDYLVDHPRYFADSLKTPLCDIYVFALDRDHVQFMEEHYNLLKGIFFSPNGGTEVNAEKNFSDRKIDVLYTGSCQAKVESYPQVDIFADGGVDFYNKTIHTLVEFPNLSTDVAIENYLATNDISLSKQEEFSLIEDTSWYIENTVRRFFKLEVPRSQVHLQV